jgi:hypothetical protein
MSTIKTLSGVNPSFLTFPFSASVTPPGLNEAPGPSRVLIHEVTVTWAEAPPLAITMEVAIKSPAGTVGQVVTYFPATAAQGGKAVLDFRHSPIDFGFYKQSTSTNVTVQFRNDAQEFINFVAAGTVSITLIYELL